MSTLFPIYILLCILLNLLVCKFIYIYTCITAPFPFLIVPPAPRNTVLHRRKSAGRGVTQSRYNIIIIIIIELRSKRPATLVTSLRVGMAVDPDAARLEGHNSYPEDVCCSDKSLMKSDSDTSCARYPCHVNCS